MEWFGNDFVKTLNKYLLGTTINWGITADFIDLFQGLRRNCIENEAFFLLSAYLYGKNIGTLGDKDYATNLIFYWLAARLIHSASYITKTQPFRSFSFIASLAIQGVFAYQLVSNNA